MTPLTSLFSVVVTGAQSSHWTFSSLRGRLTLPAFKIGAIGNCSKPMTWQCPAVQVHGVLGRPDKIILYVAESVGYSIMCFMVLSSVRCSFESDVFFAYLKM